MPCLLSFIVNLLIVGHVRQQLHHLKRLMDTGKHSKMVLNKLEYEMMWYAIIIMEITDAVAVQIMIPDPLNL